MQLDLYQLVFLLKVGREHQAENTGEAPHTAFHDYKRYQDGYSEA